MAIKELLRWQKVLKSLGTHALGSLVGLICWHSKIPGAPTTPNPASSVPSLLTTHGLLHTCNTTHSTIRQAVPERARGMSP